MDKKTLYTAIKPTGIMTLGNLIGVGQNLKNLTENYDSYICVADLHALTIGLDAETLKENTYKIFAFYLALGVDPNKVTLYVQSQVDAHCKMSWVLNNFSMFGEMSRMTQFKDYVAKQREVNVGLFCYPILMAGDILLFDTSIVPVGLDQKQHVEIARDIAIRFNHKMGDTFVVPEVLINKNGAKICGLTDPTKKMSKSANGDTGVISIEDTQEEIIKKIKRAVTDSESKVYYDVDNKPGISNLLTIYATLKQISIQEAETEFKDANYGLFKEEVAKIVVEKIIPIQKKYFEYLQNKQQLQKIMEMGKIKAEAKANKKIQDVYKKLGLVVLD